MSDRLPGSSWDNAILYRGYRIYAHDCGPTPFRFAYAHEDYDGAEDAHDSRCGYGRTVEECKGEIDDKETP